MAVTALPTPPSRSDPATFAERGDAFMSALPTFQAEINALQITTNAQTAADAAASATSAAEAVVAKNAAIAAWAASMSPAETLPALSQSLHIGAVVKAIVYDTSKDSDGGAWRKRCADKSWYTETLGGDRWIGQHATISAAWTAAGSTTGAVYQASATAGAQTSGLFYTPTSSTTVTQVYRGVTREFPAVAGIVAESARVVIYDLSNGAMWMVVSKATGYMVDSVPTSICAQNGQIIIGSTGLFYIALLQDAGFFQNTSNKYKFGPNIAGRNAAGTYAVSSAGIGIVSSTVIDVAITVLDTAPIDPATGMPVPTIAVATAGGVSVIKDDGTVVNWLTAHGEMSAAYVTPTGGLWAVGGGGINYLTWHRASVPTASTNAYDYLFNNNSVPARSGTDGNTGVVTRALATKTAKVFGVGAIGLNLLKENPATPTKGMVAYVTTAYNSGWLPGDIRGAYLADTTAETVTASGELVLTPDFAADTNWTKGTGWAIGSGVATKTAGTAANLSQVINTVVGRTYTFTFDATRSAGTLTVQAVGATVATITASATTSANFTATATTTTISFNGDSTFAGTVDNASVKLAEPDRSVKNKGLVINGSLTKTAVASGAGLVAWSGFSAANYLEQPYNSNLDFGTGDFCVMGWVNTVGTAGRMPFDRGSAGAGRLGVFYDTTWSIMCSATAAETDTAVAVTAGLNFVCAVRASGVLYLFVNGVQVYSVANTQNVSNAAATTRLGCTYAGGAPQIDGFLALWRISATAPSADQIAHIYRTELPLFQASAQCTIAGSSAAVTALAYDDTTELLHVGTSWGRTGFKDLLRVDSEATTTGALTSLSASQGVIITGGTSGKVYVPAMLLRDELRRKDEARKALGKVPVFFDHTATASQTAFVAPKGYTIKAVYHNGTLKRETTTGVYWTRSTDGFAETCTLSAGATVSDWISLMCVRT